MAKFDVTLPSLRGNRHTTGPPWAARLLATDSQDEALGKRITWLSNEGAAHPVWPTLAGATCTRPIEAKCADTWQLSSARHDR